MGKGGYRRVGGTEVDTVDTKPPGQALNPGKRPAFVVVSGGLPTAARKDTKGKLVGLVYKARVGEDHQKARLSDAEVEAMRDRFEAYDVEDPRHEGYRALARAFGVSKGTVRAIVTYRRRNTTPDRWKRLDK